MEAVERTTGETEVEACIHNVLVGAALRGESKEYCAANEDEAILVIEGLIDVWRPFGRLGADDAGATSGPTGDHQSNERASLMLNIGRLVYGIDWGDGARSASGALSDLADSTPAWLDMWLEAARQVLATLNLDDFGSQFPGLIGPRGDTAIAQVAALVNATAHSNGITCCNSESGSEHGDGGPNDDWGCEAQATLGQRLTETVYYGLMERLYTQANGGVELAFLLKVRRNVLGRIAYEAAAAQLTRVMEAVQIAETGDQFAAAFELFTETTFYGLPRVDVVVLLPLVFIRAGLWPPVDHWIRSHPHDTGFDGLVSQQVARLAAMVPTWLPVVASSTYWTAWWGNPDWVINFFGPEVARYANGYLLSANPDCERGLPRPFEAGR